MEDFFIKFLMVVLCVILAAMTWGMVVMGVESLKSTQNQVYSRPEPAWYTQQIRITEQWTPETGWQEVARDTLFYEGCIGDWVNVEEVR